MGHDWLQEHTQRDVVILDPALAHDHPAAHLTHWHGNHLRHAAFFGALRAGEDPIRYLDLVHQMVSGLPLDATVLLPPVPRRPVERQLLLTVARWLDPDRILTVQSHLHDPWPVGAEPGNELSAALDLVIEAARRGHWLQCVREGHEHSIRLSQDIRFLGARLGSGQRLPPFATWQERYADREEPSPFPNLDGLLVGLGRENGATLAWGIVVRFEPDPATLVVRSLVPPPLPVTVISVGRLRLDDTGKELESIAPWSV